MTFRKSDLSPRTRSAKRQKRKRALQAAQKAEKEKQIRRPGRPKALPQPIQGAQKAEKKKQIHWPGRLRALPPPNSVKEMYLAEPLCPEELRTRVVALMTDARLSRQTHRKLLAELSEQVGFDCATLWYNLQATTALKLRSLLRAQDRPERQPAAQRMRPSDWMLCDALLVHRRHDLTFAPRDPALEGPILSELFRLVQQFRIEELFGEALAEAWAALTLAYNSDGRRATPMLLQRRWYQLRVAASWTAAAAGPGGAAARARLPALLRDILASCPWLGEEPLDSWEELIKKKLVVPRDQLEAIGWKKIGVTINTNSGGDFPINIGRKFIKQENGNTWLEVPEVKLQLKDGAMTDTKNAITGEDRVNGDITNSAHGNLCGPLENISIKIEPKDTDFEETTPSADQSDSTETTDNVIRNVEFIKSEMCDIDIEETILSATEQSPQIVCIKKEISDTYEH